MFQCPADRVPCTWGVSFVLNYGSTFEHYQDETALHDENPEEYPCDRLVPLSFAWGPVSKTDIKDGLSTTAMASERLQIEDVYSLSREFLELDELDAMVEYYHRFAKFAEPNREHNSRGLDTGDVKYDHILTPNDVRCRNSSMAPFWALPASSEHKKGVNVLFADGSVRFMADEVDLQVWRAVGTRNGEEPVKLR